MIWGHPAYVYHWVFWWTGTQVSPEPSCGSGAAHLQTILSLGLPLWLAGTDTPGPDRADLCPHLALPCWGNVLALRGQVGGRIWEQSPQLCSQNPNSDPGAGGWGILWG